MEQWRQQPSLTLETQLLGTGGHSLVEQETLPSAEDQEYIKVSDIVREGVIRQKVCEF